MSNALKIKIKSITVTRGEGPTLECGRPVFCDTVAKTNEQLSRWSETAPDSGGYDKCDFSILFEDGTTYDGCYDLEHHTVKIPNVGEHVKSQALFYTGRFTPSHITTERHRKLLAEPHYAEIQTAYEDLMQRYDIGFTDIPARLF